MCLVPRWTQGEEKDLQKQIVSLNFDKYFKNIQAFSMFTHIKDELI